MKELRFRCKNLTLVVIIVVLYILTSFNSGILQSKDTEITKSYDKGASTEYIYPNHPIRSEYPTENRNDRTPFDETDHTNNPLNERRDQQEYASGEMIVKFTLEVGKKAGRLFSEGKKFSEITPTSHLDDLNTKYNVTSIIRVFPSLDHNAQKIGKDMLFRKTGLILYLLGENPYYQGILASLKPYLTKKMGKSPMYLKEGAKSELDKNWRLYVPIGFKDVIRGG